MNPDYLRTGLAIAGLAATLLLYILKIRDSKTAAEIKAAVAESLTSIHDAIAETKTEIWRRMDFYVAKDEIQPRLDQIQGQLDSQGGKLDMQGKAIDDIRSKITTMEKKSRRKA